MRRGGAGGRSRVECSRPTHHVRLCCTTALPHRATALCRRATAPPCTLRALHPLAPCAHCIPRVLLLTPPHLLIRRVRVAPLVDVALAPGRALPRATDLDASARPHVEVMQVAPGRAAHPWRAAHEGRAELAGRRAAQAAGACRRGSRVLERGRQLRRHLHAAVRSTGLLALTCGGTEGWWHCRLVPLKGGWQLACCESTPPMRQCRVTGRGLSRGPTEPSSPWELRWRAPPPPARNTHRAAYGLEWVRGWGNGEQRRKVSCRRGWRAR